MKPLLILSLLFSVEAFSQNVGIGTANPTARLHVTDSSVLFTAADPFSYVTPNTPVNGVGARMLWYAGKASFRSGMVDGAQWDKDNIGFFSFASGYSTRASNLYSTAMGRSTIASGTGSTALGYFTNASGSNSSAFGSYTAASGDDATALGSNTISSGFATTALGFSTIARGNHASAFGSYTKALSANSVVIGIYNDTTNSNRLFEIGNGTSEIARKNALTVLSNGNTGIGTANPLARVHVTDSSVLFQGAVDADENTLINPPFSGYGVRMMWYPQKAAFRVGTGGFDGWKRVNIGANSFASGYDTWASGRNATSVGFQNNSSGESSFTAGASNTASGLVAVSLGAFNNSAGTASVALGSGNVVPGSFAFGAGGGNDAMAAYAISIGSENESNSLYAVTIGRNNSSSGEASFALGTFSKSRAVNSMAFGTWVIAKSYAGIAMGQYNDTIDSPNPTIETPTDRLFQIGNGNSTTRSNAITILRNGFTSVGGILPAARLDVAGLNRWDLTNTEGDVRIGNAFYRIKIGVALGGAGAGAAAIHAAGGIERLNLGAANTNILTLNGQTLRVGIGTEGPSEKLEVVGNIKAAAFILSSDIRLKKNIQPLQNSLSLLTQLSGYSYMWKDESIDPSLQSGLIAQDVQKLFPHLVKQNDEGSLSVNYTGLIPVMIESIKSQQEQIDELKKQVQLLLQRSAKEGLK